MERDHLLIKELTMLLEIHDDDYKRSLEKGRRFLQTMNFAQEFFDRTLWESGYEGELYRQYWLGRGATKSDALIFGVGLALDGSSFLKEAYHKGFSEKELMDAGLMTAYGDAFFRHRIMFPLRDSKGFVVGFTGRSLDSQPKYMNSPGSPLYQKNSFFYGLDLALESIKESKTVAIVEGQMDTIALHQNGIQFTVGVSGTAFTEEHVKILRRIMPGGQVILMFDSDDAGRKATLRAGEMLEGLFEVSVSSSNLGKDASDHFRIGGKIKDFTTISYQEFKTWSNTITTSEEVGFPLELTGESPSETSDANGSSESIQPDVDGSPEVKG